jgi:soluble lytic murein transglycosylase-like protein
MTPYRSLIEAASQARDLDPNLIEALTLQESSGNHLGV